MANYAPSEFWERAEAKDKSGKFVNKKLYYASLTIPRYPNHGPGSNGGGRICICEECGISEWMNKPISMELHHKDGNHNNNNLDNLEILCPNCHSQTDTFRSKKRKDK